MTRNRMNCANTSTPLRIRPRAASRADRADSRRCTRNWSVPCVDRVSATPPRMPAHSVYGRAKVERQIEHAELAGRGADAHDLVPAAGNQRQQREEDDAGAGDVDEHLHDVGPDHRRRAAAHGVDDHRRADHDHRERDRHAGDDRDDERGRKQADAVGERAGDEEDDRGQVLDARTEAPLQQLVRGARGRRGSRPG